MRKKCPKNVASKRVVVHVQPETRPLDVLTRQLVWLLSSVLR